MEDHLHKRDPAITVLIVILLLAAGLTSFFVLGKWASKPETHAAVMSSINEKIETVLKLTATSTVASAGLSAIPGDTATPIADKLADFTEYFLLILCVLYSEKYLLTIIGTGTFQILIPAACLFCIAALFWNPRALRRLGVKFALFGIAIYLVIPLSIRVSDIIYETYQVSIETTIASAEQLAEDSSELAEAAEDQGLIQSVLGRLSATAEGLTDRAAAILNRFVETIAVMAVASCVIPILVLLFFLWIVKLLTGVEIALPMPRRPRA